jgi:ankyrin repeat protein
VYHVFISHNYAKDLILAHNSVKDYLVALPIVDTWFSFEEKLSHAIIAKTCLAYLTYLTTIFSRTEFRTEDEERYPFARYSARKWPYYLNKAHEAFTDADMMSMKSIFHKSSFSAWLTISERHVFPVEPRTVSPLYYASLKGILPAIKFLLADAEINIVGGRYGTAIQAATSQGYREIVRMLIEANADVNVVEGEYGTAIQAAAAMGYRDMVKMLIQAKADVNIVGGEYGTAIQAAATYGYQDIVETLIQAKANVNIVGGEYGTAIQAAVVGGYRDIVKTLIQAKVDVNIVGGRYGTAIQAAAAEGYRDIVETLIQANADVNIVGGRYGTAIQAAAAKGYRDIVETLIQAKADVNIVGGRYGTAIQAATGYRAFSSPQVQAIVELLIKAGANPNGASNYTNCDHEPIKSPVQYSEDLCRSGIVRLLLDAGAEDDRYLSKRSGTHTDLKNGSA